jgi:hypothetical protein
LRPPSNLFSPKPLTVLEQTVGGVPCERPAYFSDNDRAAPKHLFHACGRLRIYGIDLAMFRVRQSIP